MTLEARLLSPTVHTSAVKYKACTPRPSHASGESATSADTCAELTTGGCGSWRSAADGVSCRYGAAAGQGTAEASPTEVINIH